MTRTVTVLHTLALLLTTAGMAVAQESFADLPSKVKTGDRISITDNSGNQTRGTLEQLGSTIRLSVDSVAREWKPDDVTEIRRRGDSVMNGLTIGIVSGGATGALLGLALASLLHNEGHDAAGAFLGLTALGAGIGAGIGVGLDAAITGSTVVYRRPARTVSVRPMLAPSAQGIRVAIGF